MLQIVELVIFLQKIISRQLHFIKLIAILGRLAVMGVWIWLKVNSRPTKKRKRTRVILMVNLIEATISRLSQILLGKSKFSRKRSLSSNCLTTNHLNLYPTRKLNFIHKTFNLGIQKLDICIIRILYLASHLKLETDHNLPKPLLTRKMSH